MTAPPTTITSALSAGRIPTRPPFRSRRRKRPLGEDRHQSDAGDRQREAQAECDDQQQPEGDAMQ